MFKMNLVLSGSSAIGMFTVDLLLAAACGHWHVSMNTVLSGSSAIGMFTVDILLAVGMWTLACLK